MNLPTAPSTPPASSRRHPAGAAALLLAWSLLPGQNAPAQETLRTSTTLVIVPTLVRSSTGDLIHGLTARDFHLTDNDLPQALTLDEPAQQPRSILVLMQTGGAAARQFPSYSHLETMLGSLTGNSPSRIALVTFDSQPEEQWDFTPTVANLQDGFLHPTPGDDGARIVDALNYGIGILKKEPPDRRRILLLLSQTRDEGSKTRPEVVVKRLGESNITIYSVAFSVEKTWLKDQFTQPRHGNPSYQMSPDHAPLVGTFDLATPLIMAVRALQTDTSAEIAALSGGESFHFGSRSELEQQLATIANHIPNRYTLSFKPDSLQPGFHTLEVTLPTHPDLKVDARRSYWTAAATGP